MIKVIAFDFVGVLVNEKDIKLSPEEDKIERLFGDNIDDESFLREASKIVSYDSVIGITHEIINKLYGIRDINLFNNIRSIDPNVKIIVASNHVSYVTDFINMSFNADDVLISASIHKLKPSKEFYKYILNKYNIQPDELLFLDDNIKNIEGASVLGIKTIKVDKYTNLLKEISKFIGG